MAAHVVLAFFGVVLLRSDDLRPGSVYTCILAIYEVHVLLQLGIIIRSIDVFYVPNSSLTKFNRPDNRHELV
jgi:hypothetical protein